MRVPARHRLDPRRAPPHLASAAAHRLPGSYHGPVTGDWTLTQEGDLPRWEREVDDFRLTAWLAPSRDRWLIEVRHSAGDFHGYASAFVDGNLRQAAEARDRAMALLASLQRPGYIPLAPGDWTPADDGAWQATYRGVLVTCQYDSRRRAWLVAAQRLMLGGRLTADWVPGAPDELIAPRAQAREVGERAMRQTTGIIYGH